MVRIEVSKRSCPEGAFKGVFWPTRFALAGENKGSWFPVVRKAWLKCSKILNDSGGIGVCVIGVEDFFSDAELSKIFRICVEREERGGVLKRAAVSRRERFRAVLGLGASCS